MIGDDARIDRTRPKYLNMLNAPIICIWLVYCLFWILILVESIGARLFYEPTSGHSFDFSLLLYISYCYFLMATWKLNWGLKNLRWEGGGGICIRDMTLQVAGGYWKYLDRSSLFFSFVYSFLSLSLSHSRHLYLHILLGISVFIFFSLSLSLSLSFNPL